MMHSSSEHTLPLKRYIFEALSSQLKTDSVFIEETIRDMIEIHELFNSDWVCFWSERVKNNLTKMQEIKEKRKKAGSMWGIARMEKVASAKQKVAKSSRIKKNKEEIEPISSKEEIYIPEFSEKFQSKYKEFLITRKEAKKPVTPIAIKQHLKLCFDWWEEKAIKSIDASINSWWQWLFEPKELKSWAKPEKKTLTEIFEASPGFF